MNSSSHCAMRKARSYSPISSTDNEKKSYIEYRADIMKVQWESDFIEELIKAHIQDTGGDELLRMLAVFAKSLHADRAKTVIDLKCYLWDILEKEAMAMASNVISCLPEIAVPPIIRRQKDADPMTRLPFDTDVHVELYRLDNEIYAVGPFDHVYIDILEDEKTNPRWLESAMTARYAETHGVRISAADLLAIYPPDCCTS